MNSKWFLSFCGMVLLLGSIPAHAQRVCGGARGEQAAVAGDAWFNKSGTAKEVRCREAIPCYDASLSTSDTKLRGRVLFNRAICNQVLGDESSALEDFELAFQAVPEQRVLRSDKPRRIVSEVLADTMKSPAVRCRAAWLGLDFGPTEAHRRIFSDLLFATAAAAYADGQCVEADNCTYGVLNSKEPRVMDLAIQRSRCFDGAGRLASARAALSSVLEAFGSAASPALRTEARDLALRNAQLATASADERCDAARFARSLDPPDAERAMAANIEASSCCEGDRAVTMLERAQRLAAGGRNEAAEVCLDLEVGRTDLNESASCAVHYFRGTVRARRGDIDGAIRDLADAKRQVSWSTRADAELNEIGLRTLLDANGVLTERCSIAKRISILTASTPDPKLLAQARQVCPDQFPADPQPIAVARPAPGSAERNAAAGVKLTGYVGVALAGYLDDDAGLGLDVPFHLGAVLDDFWRVGVLFHLVFLFNSDAPAGGSSNMNAEVEGAATWMGLYGGFVGINFLLSEKSSLAVDLLGGYFSAFDGRCTAWAPSGTGTNSCTEYEEAMSGGGGGLEVRYLTGGYLSFMGSFQYFDQLGARGLVGVALSLR